MDHTDLGTLGALPRRTPVVVQPGNRDLVRRFRQVEELRLGQTVEVAGVEITSVEVRHWGARMISRPAPGIRRVPAPPGGRDGALRRGHGVYRCVRPAGPVGAGGPRDPADRGVRPVDREPRVAGRGMADVPGAGGDLVLPVHHSTFRLSREPVDEPVHRLLAAAGEERWRVLPTTVGATWSMPAARPALRRSTASSRRDRRNFGRAWVPRNSKCTGSSARSPVTKCPSGRPSRLATTRSARTAADSQTVGSQVGIEVGELGSEPGLSRASHAANLRSRRDLRPLRAGLAHLRQIRVQPQRVARRLPQAQLEHAARQIVRIAGVGRLPQPHLAAPGTPNPGDTSKRYPPRSSVVSGPISVLTGRAWPTAACWTWTSTSTPAAGAPQSVIVPLTTPLTGPPAETRGRSSRRRRAIRCSTRPGSPA